MIRRLVELHSHIKSVRDNLKSHIAAANHSNRTVAVAQKRVDAGGVSG